MLMRHPKPLLHLLLSLVFSVTIISLTPFVLFVKPYLPFLNYLLGVEKPTSYLIMLGNDAEMRANGGFAGSYAKLFLSSKCTTYNSKCKISPDLSFQDIYVPNGQLAGHVAPPAPIQQAFQHGTWQLANADWEPDFPTAATTLRWFFEKGNEINPDILTIINLTTIKKILNVVGSFSVPEYEAKITPDNLYLFLQSKAEINFFPGSTQKKDTLTAVGEALKKEILSLPLNKKIKIAQILYQDLKNQNIVVNSKNNDFQRLLENQNFAGKLSSATPDTYLLVETNLGANKANAYVTRKTNHAVTYSNNQATHQVTVQFQNSSLEANPNPPFHYGGNYIAYLRFYFPPNAQNLQISSSSATNKNLDRENKFGFTEIGFWLTTPAQGQTTITLSYTLPVSASDYSLTILKQHGLVSSPQIINIGNQEYTSSLTNDYAISLSSLDN